MKPTRSLLLAASAALVLFLVGGGLAVKVGAADNTYRRVVLFSEILGLIMDNYVDPVDAERLLRGAYEGMLGGLDPNSAYLSAEEVASWKAGGDANLVGPGVSILKSRRTLQIVAVKANSPAEEAGVAAGDHLRLIDGEPLGDLSLRQARRLLLGKPGTTVTLGILRPRDGFTRKEFRLGRAARRDDPYTLDVRRGVALLTVADPGRVDVDALSEELHEVRSRGIERLLLDLRNVSDGDPRQIAAIAGLFASGKLLRLRNRAGDVLESLTGPPGEPTWSGPVDVLVNYATAGGAEALATVVKRSREATVYGETTFGLGSEPKLVEFENGAGVLVSHAIWETDGGETWNEHGVEPDRKVEGEGDDFAAIQADQLHRVLDLISGEVSDDTEAEEEAA